MHIFYGNMSRLHLVAVQALVLVTLFIVLGREYIVYHPTAFTSSSKQETSTANLDLQAAPHPTEIKESLETPITTTSTDNPTSTQYEPSQTVDPSSVANKDDLQEFPVEEGIRYLQAIWDPSDVQFPRLSCPAPTNGRYDYLKASSVKATSNHEIKPTYFFALDLYNCAQLLPCLLGTLFETIRFLGPSNCALSIVEGRSHDGTYEILSAIRPLLRALNTTYYFTTNNIDPKAGSGVDRVEALAILRNQALHPLLDFPERHAEDTTVLFINDVALCMEDILELIHQRIVQDADMTCAMDWIFGGADFYDVWVSRAMNGDQFFEIPQSGSWEFAENLFWNEPKAKTRFEAKQPFQVYACWNGATAFTAKPIMEQKVKFRTVHRGTDECYMGEPTLFCKDMWKEGYGKIAVVPSVNVGYDDEESIKVKDRRGRVGETVEKEKERKQTLDLIAWESEPPAVVKCVPTYEQPIWVPWDQGLKEKGRTLG